LVYAAPGSYQVTVPTGVTTISLKLWGGGGGGSNTGVGGGGGFVEGDIPVTPGETLTIVVGDGGKVGSSLEAGGSVGPGGASAISRGGDSGANGIRYNAGGGGATGVLRGSTPLAIAPGGGGAADTMNGGEAGDTVGGDGGDGSGVNGDGGTQTTGGPGGVGDANGDAGSASKGGDGADAPSGREAGGGGGGGLRGGGGGAAAVTNSRGAGGGGSALVPAGGTTEGADGQNAGGDDDVDHAGDAGRGGPGTGADKAARYGNPGRAVLTYSAVVSAGDEQTAAELIEQAWRDKIGETAIRVDEGVLTSIAADADSRTFTVGGGDLTAIGLAAGSVVSLTGLSEAALNDLNLHVVAVTTSTFTVREAIVDMSADTDFELRVGTIDFVALDAMAAARPGPHGYYVRGDSPSGRQVFDAFLNSIGWAMTDDPDGLLTFVPFGTPDETADLSIDEGDCLSAPTRRPAGSSVWRLRLGYRRVWRVHNPIEISNPNASDENRRIVRQEWSEAVAARPGVRARDASAEPSFIESTWDRKEHAGPEAERRIDVWSPDRSGFDLRLDRRPMLLPLGRTIAADLPLVDVTPARNFRSLTSRIRASSESVELGIWS
ncbi:MAG: hypothetical protein AB7O45_12415, partial [Alphaproteobacteria bacterium]